MQKKIFNSKRGKDKEKRKKEVEKKRCVEGGQGE